KGNTQERLLGSVLGSCLADEAPARPETILVAVRALVTAHQLSGDESFTWSLCLGKYRQIIRDEVRSLFQATDAVVNASVFGALKTVVWHQSEHRQDGDLRPLLQESISNLQSNDLMVRCEAAACCVSLVESIDPTAPQASS